MQLLAAKEQLHCKVPYGTRAAVSNV
jgi:hypothetical protein